MKIYKTPIALAAVLAMSTAVHAQDWSFKNVSVNYLDWTGSTERKTGMGPFAQKKDFTFLEIEGGMGGKWGELYGFFDIENPGNSTRESAVGKSRRYAWKAVSRINMTEVGGFPVQFYAHIYDFTEGDFNDQNRVVGLGTSYGKGGFWIKPFAGVHQESKSGVGAHVNGLMAGWVLGYSFKLGDQSFMVTNWHEMELDRKARYLTMARNGGVVQGSGTGQNGAVSLWWNVNPTFTLGTTYRYAKDKLGSATYQDGLILTAKVNF